MQFTLPSTKEEMYEVLNELFHYYRVQRVEFEEIPLEELQLSRLTFALSTDAQLKEKAQTLLGSKYEREFNEKKAEIDSQITSLNLSITAERESANSRMEEVNELYDKSEEKIRKQAENNGLINSSAYMDKLSYLENQRNLRLSEITEDRDFKISQFNSKIAMLNSQLSEIQTNYSSVNEKEVDAKIIELKTIEQEIEREVFKYNNGLDEKEQRYRNTIIQANANLELKYREISVAELSKDQLVEMGYYEDVVNCVCGYYDRIDALTAYRDIIEETKLTIYLDDYYSNIIYMYGVRSGAIS